MKLERFTAAIPMIVGAFLCMGPASRADDFNDARLEEGRIAARQKNYVGAIDQFRVAAFGSLDKPVTLSECLVRLALVEAAAGQMSETDETLNRFLDVERRFAGAFGKAKLEPDVRADFQALLSRRIPPATLSAVPSLAELVETEEQRIARLPAAERRKALQAIAKRDANAGKSSPPPARSDVAQTRSTDPASATPGARSKQALEESRRLITAGKAGEAVVFLTGALQSDSGNRDLRLRLLEAACLARSYETAASQLPMAAPFTDREGSSMFYAAVALYETGHGTEARGYMQRALPQVAGPLVDEYSKKILGQPR